MRNYYLSRLTIFFILPITLLINACSTSSPQSENEENPPEEELSATEPVAPDGILEAVTWNIERYGEQNNFQQTKNALLVLDTLNADLYALQEIHSQEALNNLLEPLKGYDGMVDEAANLGQKTAFVYNTNTITVTNSGSIADVRPEFQNNWSYYWANGRLPFYVEFNYTYQDVTIPFYAVIVHAKANTGDNDTEFQETYERRQNAAEGLYYYLQDHKPNTNIIFLGDYNDDVDESIYNEDNFDQTPYDEFVDDSLNFRIITKALSEDGESASINYEDLIDHITMSNELFQFYMAGSAAVYYEAQEHISNYEESTSDHLPVWVKFDVAQ